jgi:hypothetical protein
VLIVYLVTACVTNVCHTPFAGTNSVKAAKKAAEGRSFDGVSARFARSKDADMDDADSQEMKAEISAACSEYGEWLLQGISYYVCGAMYCGVRPSGAARSAGRRSSEFELRSVALMLCAHV